MKTCDQNEKAGHVTECPECYTEGGKHEFDCSRQPPPLVLRLRGEYTVPVNDGAGLLDGKEAYTRHFQTTPIQHEAAARIEELEAALHKIMRTAYDEANRIANHCSDGAAKWAMQNLYDAANEAKTHMAQNDQAQARRTGGVDCK